jgi:hypothetical protein
MVGMSLSLADLAAGVSPRSQTWPGGSGGHEPELRQTQLRQNLARDRRSQYDLGLSICDQGDSLGKDFVERAIIEAFLRELPTFSAE